MEYRLFCLAVEKIMELFQKHTPKPEFSKTKKHWVHFKESKLLKRSIKNPQDDVDYALFEKLKKIN